MSSWTLALASVLTVSAVSLVGAVFLSRTGQLRARRLSVHVVAFAVGALFGDALLHLIPESYESFGPDEASLWVLLGVFGFFAVERALRRNSLHHRWHHLPPTAGVNLVGDALHNLVDGMVIGASFAAGLSALAAVVGVVLALVLGAASAQFVDVLLPVTAGGFIYLAGSDLLPELQHEPSSAGAVGRQLVLIAAGIAVMAALRLVE
jgi:zinc and cadmium transporter